ncbi:hypothetical protein MES5069_200002 [Mesorhizobium escarrei]|uniref:Propionyl-coenzyme A carboxylase alpha polypeptide n=1 Tax=Mesorhizobium escarrei TaxID=666018 RepID=A0ABM9DQR6_9HYPH|nr:hypothetical protein MES5069_200002 [Mesorhizobium escarrei]
MLSEYFVTPTVGETINESAPSPRHYTGKGCRQPGEGQRKPDAIGGHKRRLALSVDRR